MSENTEGFNSNIIFERRKFVRIDKTYIISYRDASAKELKSDVTQTKNISAGGLLLTTDKQISPETVLIVKLRLPGASDYIDIKVKVVDSKERANTVFYETRVRFVGIREEDRGAIRKIIEFSVGK